MLAVLQAEGNGRIKGRGALIGPVPKVLTLETCLAGLIQCTGHRRCRPGYNGITGTIECSQSIQCNYPPNSVTHDVACRVTEIHRPEQCVSFVARNQFILRISPCQTKLYHSWLGKARGDPWYLSAVLCVDL